MSLFAPRMWRCYQALLRMCGGGAVCSTHVEMFLLRSSLSNASRRLLHACGDVSIRVMFSDTICRFAPRMWRCFLEELLVEFVVRVCSTHVEMFLSRKPPQRPQDCLLHACGDVSWSDAATRDSCRFAPRMWRCFHHPDQP